MKHLFFDHVEMVDFPLKEKKTQALVTTLKKMSDEMDVCAAALNNLIAHIQEPSVHDQLTENELYELLLFANQLEKTVAVMKDQSASLDAKIFSLSELFNTTRNSHFSPDVKAKLNAVGCGLFGVLVVWALLGGCPLMPVWLLPTEAALSVIAVISVAVGITTTWAAHRDITHYHMFKSREFKENVCQIIDKNIKSDYNQARIS